MPAQRLLPDTATLRHWIEDEGLTHQQVAERVFANTGERVSRSTVSAAIHRAGISKPSPRYGEELPWVVHTQHITEYPARMLRLLGRRRNGGTLNEGDSQRLDSWLAKLITDNAVVGYDPNSTFGFYYVEREAGDPVDIPIRRQTITISDYQ